jgi:hypothetical protein
MKFSVGQNVAVAPDDAVAAYANPAFYEGREPSGDISLVEVVSHGDTSSGASIDVRYRFTGAVSSAVRAVIDPTKISWVTHTEIDKTNRRTTFAVLPDFYPDRLECSGTFRFDEGAGPDSTVITIAGDLTVHVFLVGHTVEQLIVAGLRKYLEAEVLTLPDFTR